jgi:diguanylate cyclase (GGDEF)-like protein
MQDSPDTVGEPAISLPATAGMDEGAAPEDPFAPSADQALTATQAQTLPETPQAAETDWGSNALLLAAFVLLVVIALLAIRIVRMREDLVFGREQRAALESEAKQLRELLRSSEQAAEIRVRHRVAQLLQHSQKAEREREALEQSNTRLRRLVKLDELTGIANAQEIGNALDDELRRALRSERPVTLIICDADSFRRYNRVHGHDKGDDLLKRIAHLTQSVFRRAGDHVGRIAGDRFAIIAAETDYDSAMIRAESLRKRIWDSAIPFDDGDGPGRVTVSLGITSLKPDRVFRPYQVFERAVLALQLAKKRGGNLVRGDRLGSHGDIPTRGEPGAAMEERRPPAASEAGATRGRLPDDEMESGRGG